MVRPTSAQPDKMLEASIEELHRQDKYWLSDIELWQQEIRFFQHLLEKIGINVEKTEHKKKMEQLQNTIIYYRDELLPYYSKKIKDHEHYLSQIVKGQKSLEERGYRKKHKNYLDKINTFADNYNEFKQELFDFVEQHWKQ